MSHDEFTANSCQRITISLNSPGLRCAKRILSPPVMASTVHVTTSHLPDPGQFGKLSSNLSTLENTIRPSERFDGCASPFLQPHPKSRADGFSHHRSGPQWNERQKMTDTFQQVSGNLDYDGNRLFLFFSPTIVVDRTNLAAVMSA